MWGWKRGDDVGSQGMGSLANELVRHAEVFGNLPRMGEPLRHRLLPVDEQCVGEVLRLPLEAVGQVQVGAQFEVVAGCRSRCPIAWAITQRRHSGPSRSATSTSPFTSTSVCTSSGHGLTVNPRSTATDSASTRPWMPRSCRIRRPSRCARFMLMQSRFGAVTSALAQVHLYRHGAAPVEVARTAERGEVDGGVAGRPALTLGGVWPDTCVGSSASAGSTWASRMRVGVGAALLRVSVLVMSFSLCCCLGRTPLSGGPFTTPTVGAGPVA